MLLSLKVRSLSWFCYVYLVPDIDECSSENDCDVNAKCLNTMGSFKCSCKQGYQGDGRNCSGEVHSNYWVASRAIPVGKWVIFLCFFFPVSVKVLPLTPLLSGVFVHIVLCAYFVRFEGAGVMRRFL